jgi:hypothetical protein
MKIGYTAINKKTKEKINFFALSTQTANEVGGIDARNWMINNLDMIYEYDFFPNGTFKH